MTDSLTKWVLNVNVNVDFKKENGSHGVGHGGRQGGRQGGQHGGWSLVLVNWAQTFLTQSLPDLRVF